MYSILIDGIVSIYVDNEYLEYSDRGTKYKQKIIQELLSFFKYLTKFSEEKVFMIYTREVKKYRMKGFSWVVDIGLCQRKFIFYKFTFLNFGLNSNIFFIKLLKNIDF